MSDLVFIDVQDQSAKNKARIKRHAAGDVHRKKRQGEALRHHDRLSQQRPLAPRLDKTARSSQDQDLDVEDETDAEPAAPTKSQPVRSSRWIAIRPAQKPHHTRNKAMILRWRSRAAVMPTVLKPPRDDLKIEYVLSESFNWMMGQYTRSWSSLVKTDPTVFDLNQKLEFFRESFFVVTDLLELQKVDAAFTVLKYILDAIPPFFREPHPELLFTLVELAYGINMPGNPGLNVKIRTHVAELSSLILGPQHPLTTLLKSRFDLALRTHVSELVFTCIIDTLSRTFGHDAYQTMVQQMGRSQFYARTGRTNEGLKLIAEVMNQWRELYGADSALTRFAELEFNLMRLQGSPQPDPEIQAQAHNTMLRIEMVAGVYRNKFTEKPPRDIQPIRRPHRFLALAPWFLQNTRYTFALYCYERHKYSSRNPQSPSPLAMADLIIESVERAIGDDIGRPVLF